MSCSETSTLHSGSNSKVLCESDPIRFTGDNNVLSRGMLANTMFSDDPWKTHRINIVGGDPEAEDDFNSIDSFPLTDSPDCTIGSSQTSRKSSQSSISNSWTKSLKSSCGSKSSNVSKSFIRRIGSNQSRTGSSTWSFSSGSSRNQQKSEYARLKSQCNKFCDIHNGAKANYLRITLLTYLRNHKNGILPTSAEMAASAKLFKMWWEPLLEVMKSNFKNINGVDRNAFYEAVSAIVARKEWPDIDTNPCYQDLLAQTLTHSLAKCNSTLTLPVSHAAFTGKILAYGFFYLPGVALYLLSLMDIKQSVVRRIYKKENQNTNPEHLMSFPLHLQPLIGLNVVPTFNKRIGQRKFPWLINERTAGWERHFGVNTVIFASFFKHFCALQSQFLPFESRTIDSFFVDNEDDTNAATAFGEDSLIKTPGMVFILAAIITDLRKISLETKRTLGFRNSNTAYNEGLKRKTDTLSLTSRKTQLNSAPTDRIRIDQLKILTAFREILHSDEVTTVFSLAFSRTFDRVFQEIALETKVYDVYGCVTVCDITEEWFSCLFSVRTSTSNCTLMAYKHLVSNWGFWLDVSKRMLNSDNVHTEIRALSFLFNVWPHLPNQDIVRSQLSPNGPDAILNTLRYATEWVLSPAVWNKMFYHWSPLVRSYYRRLLCYRVASVGIGKEAWFLDVDSAQYISESRELLKRRLAESYHWEMNLVEKARMMPDVSPSLPMPHLRVAIRRFGPNPNNISTKVEINQTRVYPFDVFDNAAYWQSENVAEEHVGSPPVMELQETFLHASNTDDFNVDNVSLNSNLEEQPQAGDDDSTLSKLGESMNGSYVVAKKESDYKNSTVNGKAANNNGVRSNFKSLLSSAEDNKSILERAKPPSLQKGFSLLRKLISSPKSPAEPNSNSEPIHKSILNQKNCDNAPVELKQSTSQTIPLPPQLIQPRPDITRPPYRFVMVPVTTRPLYHTGITIPKLPFSNDGFVHTYEADIRFRSKKDDLAVWNYGGRSLAEWNIDVHCFEMFAQQQSKLVNETLEMFSMPFLVAEIPWRAII